MNILHRHSRLCLGLLVLVGLAGSGLAVRAEDPTDVDRSNIATLGKLLVARADAAEQARAARDDAEIAVKRAQFVLDEAEKTRTIAQISVKEYLEGSFPQDRQTLLAEIKLAESDLARATNWLASVEKQREKGTVSENQVLAVQMSKQKSEIGLSNAKLKLNLLEKFTRTKTTAQLESNVKKAEGEELRSREVWQAARTVLDRANRRHADESVTAGESQAIARLDEAISLLDEGKAEAARAKLHEAWKLRDEALAAREKARFQALKDRIRAEANKVRDGK